MENRDENHIPGTDFIFKQDIRESDNLRTDGDIVLVPQPTNSPNDPLNWSKPRKYWHMLLVLIVTGLTAATSNSASAAQNSLVDEYGFSWGVFNTGAGVLFIGIGYWTLLSSPSVFLWGSRINYIVGLLLGIIGAAWYANVKTNSDAIWSQLFAGASEAVAEAVAQLSLTQIFFQHQASEALGLYILATSVGTFLGPMIGGYAADNLGWQWVGYLGLITSGFMLVVVYFGLEETYFDRKHYELCHPSPVVQRAAAHTVLEDTNLVGEKKAHGEKPGQEEHHFHPTLIPSSLSAEQSRITTTYDDSVISDSHLEKAEYVDPPKSYWKRIALITPAVNLKGWGFKQYAHRLWLTLRVFSFPAVIYSGLQWGAQDAWLTFYITAEDDYWADAPWHYSDAGVAIMNIPTLIGAVIGCFYGSYCADWFVLWMAHRNKGVREAESRLYFLLLPGLIAPAGMFLFGIGTEHGWSWPLPYVGLGFIGFGWGCAGDISMSYLVDCYPEMVLEGMVGVSVINNTLGMIFSFVCDTWMDASGPQNTFIAIGVLEFFFMVIMSIPMIIWGKSCRKWTRGMYYSFIDARDNLDKYPQTQGDVSAESCSVSSCAGESDHPTTAK